ncbi:hypothetical protein K1X76_09085, partial [bacterium]|nr:hypothetical protein [bacterium]
MDYLFMGKVRQNYHDKAAFLSAQNEGAFQKHPKKAPKVLGRPENKGAYFTNETLPSLTPPPSKFSLPLHLKPQLHMSAQEQVTLTPEGVAFLDTIKNMQDLLAVLKGYPAQASTLSKPSIPSLAPVYFGMRSTTNNESYVDQIYQAILSGDMEQVQSIYEELAKTVVDTWLCLSNPSDQMHSYPDMVQVLGLKITEMPNIISDLPQKLSDLQESGCVAAKQSSAVWRNVLILLLNGEIDNALEQCKAVQKYYDALQTQLAKGTRLKELEQAIKPLEARAAPLRDTVSVYRQELQELFAHPPYAQADADVLGDKITVVESDLKPIEQQLLPLLKETEEIRWEQAVASRSQAKMGERVSVYLLHPELTPNDTKLRVYLEKIREEERKLQVPLGALRTRLSEIESMLAVLDKQIGVARA